MLVCTTPDVSIDLQKKLAEETQQTVVQNKVAELDEKDRYQAEILITYGNFEDAITVQETDRLPNLRWIHVLSSGTEQLPKDTIRDRALCVTSSKGIHSIPMSEYVICAILYFAKRIGDFRKLQDQMRWSYSLGMSEIYGKTLCVLGTGFIGTEIAKKAKALGMEVIGFNRSGRASDGFDQTYKIRHVNEFIPSFDYICNALPSTKETRGLIDKEMIRSMKDGVIFINVGRGDLAVEADLEEGLRTGKIGGAALDVFNKEPLEPGHPFWSMENVIITPHASARTERYMERALDIFIKNYHLYKENAFENMVNKVSF